MAATSPRKTTPTRKPARKPTARRAAAKPAAATNLGLVLDRPENQAVIDAMIADREPFFTVSGTTYTIPKQVPPSWSFEAWEIATTEGEAAALEYAATQLIENGGWVALSKCKTLTQDDMHFLLNAMLDRILPEGTRLPKASTASGTNGSQPSDGSSAT